jgi:hypothetical protein
VRHDGPDALAVVGNAGGELVDQIDAKRARPGEAIEGHVRIPAAQLLEHLAK